MRNLKDQKYTIALGVGTADIFFILLSFFLVMTLLAEKAKKEELLFKLPFYAGKVAVQPELSPWKVAFSKNWYMTNSDTVLWVESKNRKRSFVTTERPPSRKFVEELEAFFTKFIKEEQRIEDISQIPGFDIYGDYGTPYGAVFEVTGVCSRLKKVHAIIYREMD